MSHSSDDPVLICRNLTLALGGVLVLRDVSFILNKAERLVIVGANGAGKTALLRCLHGLRKPDKGRVDLFLSNDPMRAKLDQAFVFQKPVMMRRSVENHAAFILSARGVPNSQRKASVTDALALAGLQASRTQPARTLSGGQQQLLSLACILITRPKLIFLDEPTAHLDPVMTGEIERLILEASSQGAAIVMVTHDLGQARRLSQKVGFLHQGNLLEYGDATLLKYPNSPAFRAWQDGALYKE